MLHSRCRFLIKGSPVSSFRRVSISRRRLVPNSLVSVIPRRDRSSVSLHHERVISSLPMCTSSRVRNLESEAGRVCISIESMVVLHSHSNRLERTSDDMSHRASWTTMRTSRCTMSEDHLSVTGTIIFVVTSLRQTRLWICSAIEMEKNNLHFSSFFI